MERHNAIQNKFRSSRRAALFDSYSIPCEAHHTSPTCPQEENSGAETTEVGEVCLLSSCSKAPLSEAHSQDCEELR